MKAEGQWMVQINKKKLLNFVRDRAEGQWMVPESFVAKG